MSNEKLSPDEIRQRDDLLHRRLEMERRELENAPVVKIDTGHVLRCHICGCVTNQLYEITSPVTQPFMPGRNIQPVARRMACHHCHPEARQEWWKLQ